MQIPKENLEKYGNSLTISGMVVGNDLYQEIIMFPEESLKNNAVVFNCTADELQQIFNQLDTLEITTAAKVVLRKSQRTIEQGVSWAVFRRDGFKCRYCGADSVPMTVDHIVLWEDGGESVPDNLNCSCRKCNKTRGNLKYQDWLVHQYYLEKVRHLPASVHENNTRAWDKASLIPVRQRQRSR